MIGDSGKVRADSAFFLLVLLGVMVGSRKSGQGLVNDAVQYC